MEFFDAIVIGGGTAGMTAARRMAGAGRKVALIEQERIGGDCLYSGCVPSKSLIHSAWWSHRAKEHLDFARVLAAKDSAIQTCGEHDTPEALGQQGIRVIPGRAAFTSPHAIKATSSDGSGADYQAGQYFIATGSRPVVPPITGLKEAGYLTNVDVFHHLKRLPASLVVLGAGPIGIELAQTFARLGSKITVVELTDCVLPRDDKEVTCALQDYLKEEGVEFHIETKLTKVGSDGPRKTCFLEKQSKAWTVETEDLLIVVGRTPNLETLNLEAAGVQYTKRGILVNDELQTSVPHIWALGDVVGPYLFTYVSEYHGHIAAHNALTRFFWNKRKVDYSVIPWCTFSDPEVAHVGMTEQEAHKACGVDAIHVARAYFKDLDRAKIMRETKGFVKVIGLRRNARLLGAHIIGPHGDDLIHYFTLAMRKKVPITQLVEAVHYVYPTLSEAARWACVQWVNTRSK